METPIGFVRLREAADMVGRKIVGPSWRPIEKMDVSNSLVKECSRARRAEFVMRSGRKPNNKERKSINLKGHADAIAAVITAGIAAGLDPSIDRVIKMIAEQCEAGEIATAYQDDCGRAENLDRRVWQPSPHWRNYFATGEIELDLPLLDDERQPFLDEKGDFKKLVRCTREIFVRQKDIDRFVATLAAPQKGRAGAPEKYDWDALEQKFFRLWEELGDYRRPENSKPGWNSRAAAARKVLEGNKPDETPDEKVVERHIKAWLEERGT